jgi:hypothetical protein
MPLDLSLEPISVCLLWTDDLQIHRVSGMPLQLRLSIQYVP